MNEPKQFGSKPAHKPGTAAKPTPAPARPPSNPAKPTAANPARPQAATGKVVHDERGNAVWDWLKQTGRNAIDSTTRLLRKLEAPELNVEKPEDEELRIQPDSGASPGGGYDPYNQPIKSRRTPIK